MPVSRGIPASAVAELIVLEYGSQDALDTIDALGDTVAAVLVEPVQCRNPALRPADFLRSLRDLTARRGIVLLFDEMLTGLRPHPRGAQHHFGVVPDLATYGKALGSGFPIGAIAGRADILDGVDGGLWQYGDDSRPRTRPPSSAVRTCSTRSRWPRRGLCSRTSRRRAPVSRSG